MIFVDYSVDVALCPQKLMFTDAENSIGLMHMQVLELIYFYSQLGNRKIHQLVIS